MTTVRALSPAVAESLVELRQSGFLPRSFRPAHATLSHQELAEALAVPDDRVFVVAIRLANLSDVNSVFGYEAGDLLQELVFQVAGAIVQEADSDSVLVRSKGSQTLILHRALDDGLAEATARRVSRALEAAVLRTPAGLVRPRPIVVGLELGDDELTSDHVLRLLYHARRETERSGQTFRVLSRDDKVRLQDFLERRAHRTVAVGEALARGNVTAHYQPIVDLSAGRLVVVEALARIETDEGIQPAVDFIDIVHELRQTPALDAAVMAAVGAAGRQLARVTDRLFVNVSPLSLTSHAFRAGMESTMERLERDGLELALVLELTEQAVCEHLDVVRELSSSYGVSFAVDDFGSGYSSLETVTELAVDGVISFLKIDGSLVRRVTESDEAYKVLLAIGQLARSLDLEVIAEHVETSEIQERLRLTGLSFGQGYVFGRPMPLGELVETYAGRASSTSPDFDRRQLRILEPYLDPSLRVFYDTLLTDSHFASFFTGEEQIRDLVRRQRKGFLDALEEDEPALRSRYRRLGQLHHGLGLPFALFLKGTAILNEELLAAVAELAHDGSLVRATLRFFRQLTDFMALGYLEEELSVDRRQIMDLLAAVAGGRVDESPLFPCLESIQGAFASPPVEDTLPCSAAGWLAGLADGKRLVAIHGWLHEQRQSLDYLVSRGDYASALLVYRALHARFVSLVAGAINVDRS